ncbi:MAG: MBL fold metallo-hydrolase [Planctomycetaceae bacterium]|jgi:metallo-beta-lactamase family protein|nr:MBL fold metallo-hydrolase [Planctomycetaceae bacterium]MCE2815259.1 MBL fold metallo-hydrolase [Planctomycetaceae bacterium]
MEIVHHGGYLGVTGSCHQLHLNSSESILIDCGSFQGADARRRPSPEIDFSLDGITALLLTHVHIDHIGRIPYLIEAGFHKPIYCTPPTAKFLPVMLEDAIRLGITRNKKVVANLLKSITELIHPVSYGKWQSIPGNAEFRFSTAGHILGAAVIEVKNKESWVCFSGDLGSRCTPILNPPVSPERADILVMESTYGDRIHEGRENRMQRLEAILLDTLENRGVTLIPAFSLGRTQELLYELNQIIEGIGKKHGQSALSAYDIIVDSPLAIKLTDIYEQMEPYWGQEAREVLTVDSQPFVFNNLIEIDRGGESAGNIEYLKRSGKPAIIIAGSGMCAGGRIMDYLRAFLHRPNTDVVFVGYQAVGTTGRAIQDCQEGKCSVRIDQKEYPVRAKTHTLSGYSAHADQLDLIKFIQGIPKPPKEIRLVHGEEHAKEALQKKLTELGYNANYFKNQPEDGPIRNDSVRETTDRE